MFKAMIAFVCLLVLGMVGLVMHKEMNRTPREARPAVDEVQDVVTISHGERVEVERHIASKGLTLVEFYADF